jgi:hypothetical protein
VNSNEFKRKYTKSKGTYTRVEKVDRILGKGYKERWLKKV